jgi:phage shock protein C
MEKVTFISLSGHPVKFRSREGAYEVLKQYLEAARLRLKDDPDHEEVLRDLEQSIAEKLALRMRSEEQVLDVDDVNGVLAEVGPVDPGNGDLGSVHELPAGPTPSGSDKGRTGYFWRLHGAGGVLWH